MFDGSLGTGVLNQHSRLLLRHSLSVHQETHLEQVEGYTGSEFKAVESCPDQPG